MTHRKTYLFAGISPQADVRCYNNTIQGMERALKERLFYIPSTSSPSGWLLKPVHARGVILSKMQPFLAAMKTLSSYTHPWTRQQFADSYTGQKRHRYTQAALRLDDEGLLREDSNLKFFMKFETFNLLSKPDPSPRGINPPDDKYLVEFGRYIKPLEKNVYRAAEQLFGYPVIVKGLNQTERGRLIGESWSKYANPVCVAMDASKFEQSVSSECIEFESRLYSRYYPGDKLFRYMMNRQKSYKGKAKSSNGSLSFKIEGVRASGMNNTALGNCVISAGFLYDIKIQLDIDFRVHIDGDDVIVIMDASEEKRFREFCTPYYEQACFRMKMDKTVDTIEHIDFCQSRPVFDGKDYLMVRNVIASLSKDAVSKKPLDNPKIFEKWAAAVGAGGLSCTGGIPIHQSYYEVFVRSSNGAKPLVGDPLQRSNRYKTRGMERTKQDILPVTRCSYWLAFGIDPDSQIAIEKYYDDFVVGPQVDDQLFTRYPTLPWG